MPEGNYRITLHGETGDTRVFAEQRRLVGRGRQHFVVNVRTPDLGGLPANAPGGTQVRLKPREIGAANWDDRLTLEFEPATALPARIDIEPVDLPTLYLAGDSTVTDQPMAPNASWGQRLPALFDDGLAIANHAESGETLKSFVTEQRFDKLLSRARAGDWVMIQFAHNDQKTQWPQTYVEAATTYRAWLHTYVAEIRRRGTTPLFVTSPERRNFDAAGRIVATLGDYPAAMRAVAREDGVALIDLEAMSRRVYEALGPDEAPRAFADGGKDRTHFNELGADLLARCIATGLRDADPALTAGLEKHLVATTRFDPDHPEPR
ncbi:MAG TPA: rhamnogalacturonan acetylesterase [Steroidobacteraceae bacterium]|nr:rhamnogalacturonan acetylesterase [Steroidobacteraceae bacterium]